MKSLMQLPKFQGSLGTGADELLIPNLPQGLVYDGIILVLSNSGGAFVIDDISEITVRLGSKDIVEQISGTQLSKINQYFGLTQTTSYLTIPFINRLAREYEAGRIGAVDTRNFKYPEFSLKVKMDGTQTGTSTLNAFAVIGNEKPLEDGEGNKIDTRPFVRALLKSTKPLSVTGANEFQVAVGSSPANLLRAAHIFHSNITHLEVKKDQVNLWDKMAIAEIRQQQTEYKRTVQSGLLNFDAVLDGDEFEALSLRRADGSEAAMKWVATTSGSDTAIVYSDIFSTVPGL